jgi:hypothetical protein
MKKVIATEIYIFILLGFVLVSSNSCKKDDTNSDSKIVLTTNSISDITQSSATSGGNIVSNGGFVIEQRGICWSTNSNPEYNDSTSYDSGTELGTYTSYLTDLMSNTTYYVRAFVKKESAYFYGNEVSFKTRMISFQSQIQPIFSSNCIGCHNGSISPDLRAGTAFESLANGGYLNTSNPTSSPLYSKIISSGHFSRTSEIEKQTILLWITQGALNN